MGSIKGPNVLPEYGFRAKVGNCILQSFHITKEQQKRKKNKVIVEST